MTDIRDPEGPALPRNVKLTVEYDGTRFLGWQRQVEPPTVQGELEEAAGRVVDHPVVLNGSGRTDRGVHALGQVANFRTSKTIPVAKLRLGINTYLPDDIRVLEVEDVASGFHARYSALGKRYRYTFLLSPVERVLVRRYSETIRSPLDVEAMARAASRIPGIRDFKAFEGNAKRRQPLPGEPPRSTVRTVAAVLVRERPPFLFIDAFGRGFLYGMVRTIAGTLLEVGMGKRPAEVIEEVIASRDRREAGITAPAKGLCLLRVYYRPGEMEEAIGLAGKEREPGGESGEDHEGTLKSFF